MQFQSSSKRKAGKEISEPLRLEFSEKISANKFSWTGTKDSISGPLNRGGIARLLLYRTLIAIPWKFFQPRFREMADFCFITINPFDSFKNHFATIAGLSKLGFRDRRCSLSIKMKETLSTSYCSSTSSWKPYKWMKLDLILTMRDLNISCNLINISIFKLQVISLWNYTTFQLIT